MVKRSLSPVSQAEDAVCQSEELCLRGRCVQSPVRLVPSQFSSDIPLIHVRFEVFHGCDYEECLLGYKSQFVPHRKHINSPLQSPAGKCYVRSDVFTAVTMKNVIFWDMKTQIVPHRWHITSSLHPSRLMLWKIWGFHGGDYEECRLLGYKIPVRSSRETHYISAT
jgi:hypothetical protein